jgi:hypothetical protein
MCGAGSPAVAAFAPPFAPRFALTVRSLALDPAEYVVHERVDLAPPVREEVIGTHLRCAVRVGSRCSGLQCRTLPTREMITVSSAAPRRSKMLVVEAP